MEMIASKERDPLGVSLWTVCSTVRSSSKSSKSCWSSRSTLRLCRFFLINGVATSLRYFWDLDTHWLNRSCTASCRKKRKKKRFELYSGYWQLNVSGLLRRRKRNQNSKERSVLVSMSFSFHLWATIRSLVGLRLEEEEEEEFRRWKRNPSRRRNTTGKSRVVDDEIFTLLTPPPTLCAIFLSVVDNKAWRRERRTVAKHHSLKYIHFLLLPDHVVCYYRIMWSVIFNVW